MEDRAADVVEVPATCVHLPRLALAEPPQLHLAVVCARHEQVLRRVEGDPVDAAVVPLQDVLHDRVGLADAASDRAEEAMPRLGFAEPARFVDMARQKISGQAECVVDRLRASAQARAAQEEGRQRQHTVVPRRAGLCADRAPRLGRHIGESVAAARRGTARQIQSEAQFLEQQEIE